MSINKQLKIGDLTAKLPIIQGGMGVGVSRSSLAGAVAKEGGVGIISTAQIGYDEEGFEKDQAACNNRAIHKHIKRAKEIAQGNGLVGVNIMVALKHYAEHVKEAVAAGADVIISGAGLPMNLPELVSETCRTKIAPIVSSKRAAQLILKMWAHKYDRTADFLVVEGPKAGGHLGFSREQLNEIDTMDYDEEIRQIIACKEEYEKRYEKKIPVIVAGGIFDKTDIEHAFELGADGVQIASRFVATEECDADVAFKQAYVDAKPGDAVIVKSPVGMPGRALNNNFIANIVPEGCKIKRCFNCLTHCDPKTIPYCISQALFNGANGDIDHGLIFCGANVEKVDKITTVHEIFEELTK